MTDSTVSLQVLYSRALQAASKASQLPTIDDATQELVKSALTDLNLLYARIHSLSLFSPNEILDEISSKDVIYMTVPYILAELELIARSTERQDRLMRLRRAKAYLSEFTSLLESYSVVPEDEKKLYAQRGSSIAEPAKRREVKIAQFKKEKEIKTKIAALRAKHGQTEVDTSNAFELVESLLAVSNSEEDEEQEGSSRQVTVLLLRLQWAQMSAHIESMEQEIELLAQAPPEGRGAGPKKDDEDDTWRLDKKTRSLLDQGGPLLDASGRPLRPFTILPAGGSERARLQAEVFRPDHRLPTMGIDEFLDEERQRGNIISGGGPQSYNAPTKKEQLALDAENDGAVFGEEKAEEKRLEDEQWAQFTDTHPRGAGNTMNRG